MAFLTVGQEAVDGVSYHWTGGCSWRLLPLDRRLLMASLTVGQEAVDGVSYRWTGGC